MNEINEGKWLTRYVPWIVPIILFMAIVGMLFSTPALQNSAFLIKSWFSSTKVSTEQDLAGVENQEMKTIANIAALEIKLQKRLPDKPYIIINTTDNKFVLRDAKDTIRTGVCSTGSYIMLIGENEKKWIFKTPKGMFSILNKRKSPVWTKPDWSFIEEGLPVPSARSTERIEPGVLGDYALGFGDGYMLHGTLYQRFLGLPVTHGCIRLGDADLEVIFNNLSIGSKVFIY